MNPSTSLLPSRNLHRVAPIERHSTSSTASGASERRPKKSANMPVVKWHAGWSSLLAGSASCQSLESTATTESLSALTAIFPQPVAWKYSDARCWNSAISSSSGLALPCARSHARNDSNTLSPPA